MKKKIITALALFAMASSALATTCPSPTAWSHIKGQPWTLNAEGWQAHESADTQRAKTARDSDATSLSEYTDVGVDVDSDGATCKYFVGFTPDGDNVYAIAENTSKVDTTNIKQPPFKFAGGYYACSASNPLALALCAW